MDAVVAAEVAAKAHWFGRGASPESAVEESTQVNELRILLDAFDASERFAKLHAEVQSK